MKLSGKWLLGSDSWLIMTNSVNRFHSLFHFRLHIDSLHSTLIRSSHIFASDWRSLFKGALTMIPYALHQLTQWTTNLAFDFTIKYIRTIVRTCKYIFEIFDSCRVLLLAEFLLPSAYIVHTSLVLSLFGLPSNLCGLAMPYFLLTADVDSCFRYLVFFSLLWRARFIRLKSYGKGSWISSAVNEISKWQRKIDGTLMKNLHISIYM